MNFSVLTSLYKSNTPVEVRDCFRSISLQTILPTEVVVIIDGPISQDLINEINQKGTEEIDSSADRTTHFKP